MANLESLHTLQPHPGVFWALTLPLFLFGTELSPAPLANPVTNLPNIFDNLTYARNLGMSCSQIFSRRQSNSETRH